MSDAASKKDLQDFEKRVDKRFEALMTVLDKFANDVDKRLTGLENTQAVHSDELRKINKKYDHLVSTIDGFIARIDKYETELLARDHKIDRLERWIEEIAKKTGVSMPKY